MELTNSEENQIFQCYDLQMRAVQGKIVQFDSLAHLLVHHLL